MVRYLVSSRLPRLSAFPLQWLEIQQVFMFSRVCQLSDFTRAVFHIHLLPFSRCLAVNETISAWLKQQLVTCLVCTKFLGNYSDQWRGCLLLRFRSRFSPSALFFLLLFSLTCQSLLVTVNRLQTEPGASHSCRPSRLLRFLPSNLSV